MIKVFMLCTISLASFAAYNPFFEETPKQKPQTIQTPIKQPFIKKEEIKPIPKRKKIDISYFGFIETDRGSFALVGVQNKNIVIKKDDSLYIDEDVFKVFKITSNYILIKDNYSRVQTIYFSSQEGKRDAS